MYGNVISTVTMKNSMKFPQTFKNRIIWYINSTSEHFSKKNKNTNLKQYMHFMFKAALFIVAKIWKKLKYLLNEWINNLI